MGEEQAQEQQLKRATHDLLTAVEDAHRALRRADAARRDIVELGVDQAPEEAASDE